METTFMDDDKELKAELFSQWRKYWRTINIGECLESTSFISSVDINKRK